jgi:CcmD family protein
MAYMVAAYFVIWLASFAFILSMVRRQRNLQREIEALREVAQEQRPSMPVSSPATVNAAK